ncbi:protein translocase subunit SecD, partial [bacterium]|nr:protein translocase subunit SecD [bacterium]
MGRKNLVKTLIIILSLAWSIVVLLPTYQLNQQRESTESLYTNILANTSLSGDDINAALATGNLELQVRNHFTSANANALEGLMADVQTLVELDEKIAANDPKSIKLGLDLQGGTYLVYEVDLEQLLLNVAKVKDDNFENAVRTLTSRVKQSDEDFLAALPEVFHENGLQLNRYFGGSRDSDSEIISKLKDEAEDAINRTLEVLRNRVDQFGVSEPSITKQGSQRIIIELAGVQDVGRAKSLIGKTAQLEFQLEKDPQVINKVRNDINLVMKRQMARATGANGDSTASSDSLPQTAKIRQGTDVSLNSVFGDAKIGETPEGGEADDTVSVDTEVFQERPFDALLADLGGNIGVPTKNRLAVERILNSPEVQAVIPRDSEFLFSTTPERAGDDEFYLLYMLKKEAELKGDKISNARANPGTQLQLGRWVVNMELDGEGAKIFSRVTGANVNKRLGIVLDERVVSIPNIQERIPSGRAQITGMANIEEAQDLAIVLRAGALPAPVEVIEERTVGPSLGEDSIRAGTTSALAGMAMVVIFMVIYYRLSGLIANIALLMNLLLIMAVLAGFHATLTLPGVAGIILTIGMAVDANVLIFERIREELRNGKTVRAAIDSGYARAFKTILDANVTTLLTALVLYQFGTGPIRG